MAVRAICSSAGVLSLGRRRVTEAWKGTAARATRIGGGSCVGYGSVRLVCRDEVYCAIFAIWRPAQLVGDGRLRFADCSEDLGRSWELFCQKVGAQGLKLNSNMLQAKRDHEPLTARYAPFSARDTTCDADRQNNTAFAPVGSTQLFSRPTSLAMRAAPAACAALLDHSLPPFKTASQSAFTLHLPFPAPC